MEEFYPPGGRLSAEISLNPQPFSLLRHVRLHTLSADRTTDTSTRTPVTVANASGESASIRVMPRHCQLENVACPDQRPGRPHIVLQAEPPHQ
jgi:hypothetical protein